MRATNPLNPVYALPGATELGKKGENDPFGGSSLNPNYVK